jgi:hypothetical protein
MFLDVSTYGTDLSRFVILILTEKIIFGLKFIVRSVLL